MNSTTKDSDSISTKEVKILDLNRQVFTTGQIARICFVAPRTVSKWFDTGRLKGYRIPGSNDRRVRRKELIEFLKENGMMPNFPVSYGQFGLTPEAFTLACDRDIPAFKTALEIPLCATLTDLLLGPTEGIEVARQVKVYCDGRGIKTTWVIGDDGYWPDWIENGLTVEELRRHETATA